MDLPAELLQLVHAEARRVARRLPSGVALEDLVGFGRIGLLEARDRFDPRRGVNFEVFARHRIRGAIFDGLRTLGRFRRRGYEDLRRQALAHEALGDPAPTPPAGPDRAHDAAAVHQAIADLAMLFMVDAARSLRRDERDPERDALRREDVERLQAIMLELPDEDREVLTAIYDLDDSGDSGAALARRRGVTRSSISRRHLQLLRRLRARLERR